MCSYFIIISLICQLRNLIEKTGILGLLSYSITRRKINLHAIEDIQDGLLYKKHFGSDGYFKGTSDKKKKTEIHISFQINTDGVALFRSSKYNIWPIYLAVSELPPNWRYNIMQCMHVPLTGTVEPYHLYYNHSRAIKLWLQ